MRSKLLIYVLPVLLAAFLIYGYSTQDDPRTDAAPEVTTKSSQSTDVSRLSLISETDTLVPANFPPTLWNYNYSTIIGENAGTVGACYFDGKYINNRWNNASLYRLNPDGQNGGPGTIADSNTAYNGGTGAIRDMTVGPDGSGTLYLWGGAAGTALYKMDAMGNRLATYTHAGAAYRTIAWDPNRKGFWSSNFSDNLVCRDTNGVVIKTLTNTLAGKYGIAFDSTSTADSAFLWVWSQGGTGLPNDLHRIHIASNIDTRTYSVAQAGGTCGLAGGAEAFMKDGKFILSLNYQNCAIVGYVLKDGGPPPPVCNYMWSSQTSGTANTFYSVSAVSDQVCWTAGVASTVRKTTNGGLTWTDGNSTPGTIAGDIYNIYAWSENDALCTTSPAASNIYKTTNGGTTWTLSHSVAGGFINAIQMVSATEGYATGDPVGGIWEFLKTTNGGATWAQVATAPAQVGAEAGWNNSFSILGTNIWWGTNSTKVYRSTDMGVTWSSGASTGSVNTYALHYNNPTTGIAGGTATVKSADGGATYTAATSPGVSGNINGFEGVGTDWWGIRSGATVYRSTNGATTWTDAYTQTGAVYQDIDFVIVNGCPVGWSVGNLGVVSKMSNITGISNIGGEVPVDYTLGQNYPNPFNPETNINFTIPKSGNVTLKIYDVSGKEVSTLVNEVKNAGNYIVGFNAANLPSGAYFYRLETNGFVNTKKMMLIK